MQSPLPSQSRRLSGIGTCIYKTSKAMEEQRSEIEKVMGIHTDKTLEWFKTLAEKTNRFFERDFAFFLDNVLKISFTKLDHRCVIVVCETLCGHTAN